MREMKDSGVAWIGEIPVQWGVVYLSSIVSKRKHKNEGMKENNLLSLSYGNVVRKNINTSDGLLPANFEGYNIIELGDIVLRLTDLQNDHTSLRTGLCKEKGIITSAYVTLNVDNDIFSSDYLHYLMHSFDCCKGFYGMGSGVRQGLNYDGIKKIEILMPDKTTQQKIAAHLDRKCTQIDALISNAQQQIEKLKAYKQSVITETVTKGLDPDVQMKDSGVEWIGEIPGNAELTKVSHLFNLILGKMVSPTKSKADETLESYFCAANVHFDDLQYDKLKTMWFDSNEKETYLVQKGDLLVVEGGAGAGGSHIVEKDIENCYVQNSVMIVRRKKHVPEKWLYYIIYMLVKNNYIDYVCNKATIPHFTKDKLNNTPVVFYKEEQMKKMIAYLDHKCSRIDKLIALKQQKIEKLQQYKKSLIYEYVTGKKEV